jgi:hypothetical protein
MRWTIQAFRPLAIPLVSAFYVHAQSAPLLAVDASTDRHPIRAEIYGIANGVDSTFAKEIQLPNFRWGGDATTRYNWQVDSSNAGFDWYFMGGNGQTTPVPGASVDQLITTYGRHGARALITVPIIPYINKSSSWTCSFPVSIYGNQQSTNPYVFPNGNTCGNSISTNGAQLLDTNIYANHIDNSTSLQQGWIEHLVSAHGTAARGGVPFYQLDNEPGGWSNTHRDVEPIQPLYPVIVQLGQQYAAAIKEVDPSAQVFGPSDFTDGGWIGTPSQQDGLLAGQYYLQQMAEYEKQHHQRILDYFDEHYYPAFTDQASQLEVTRTFWDPTYNSGSWVEQWYFDGPMMLIPRFQNWVSRYYPGTKVALSEYSIDSGKKTIVDALAEMDVLGIFGRQELGFANMWNPPSPTDPIAYSFRMFRSYDGKGSHYGDVWVNSTSTNQAQLSIYGSQRTRDGALTILVLNKTTASITTTLSITGIDLPATAAVYSYSNANLQQIVENPSAAIRSGSINYTYPGYSATLFVVADAGKAASQ